MPVRLAGFAAALVSATAVAGYAMPAAMRSPAWIAADPTRARTPNPTTTHALDRSFAAVTRQAMQLAARIFRVASGAPDRVRPAFGFDPKNATAIDLHAALRNETSQQTETWLFRWTPE
jgi:glucan biosynthesis protein